MALMAIARPLRISSRSLTTTSRLQKDKDIDQEKANERQRLRYEAQKLGWDPKELLIHWLAGQSADQDRWANDAWKCDGQYDENYDRKSNQDEPWFQLPAVLGSLGAFLLYFVILR